MPTVQRFRNPGLENGRKRGGKERKILLLPGWARYPSILFCYCLIFKYLRYLEVSDPTLIQKRVQESGISHPQKVGSVYFLFHKS